MAAPDTAWQIVSDSLLGGLAHALSNRAATVGALAAFVESDDPPARLAETLGSEAERLDQLVHFLRLLAREGGDEAEPIHLPSLVRETIALHAHHRDLRAVRLDADDAGTAHPVRAPRAALARAILGLLALAARGALDAGHRRLVVRVEGEPRRASVRIAPHPDDAVDAPRLRLAGAPLDAIALADVRALASDAGGDVEEGPAPAQLALRLPTIVELRRRERHLTLA